ncbi:MAG: GumC family protein [Chitinophagaceae bacterium]
MATTGNTLDVQRLIRVLLRNSYWIVLGGLLGFFIAKTWLRYQVPTYEVKSKLGIGNVEMSSQADNILKIAGLEEQQNLQLNNEILILTSYDVLARVIDSLQLQWQITSAGRIKKVPIAIKDLPVTFFSKVHPETKGGDWELYIHAQNFEVKSIEGNYRQQGRYNQPFRLPSGDTLLLSNPYGKSNDDPYLLHLQPLRQVVATVKSNLKITPSKATQNILDIGMVDEVPSNATAFITTLTNEYNRLSIVYKNQAIRKALDFLDKRIATVEHDIDLYQDKITGFRLQYRLIEPTGEAALALSQLNTLDLQDAQIDYQRELLAAIEQHLNTNVRYTEIIANALSIADPVLQGMVGQYNQLVLARKRNLVTGTAQDPLLPQMDAQLQELRSGILKNLQNIRTQYNTNERFVNKQQNKFLNKFSQLPPLDQELIGIRRQLSIKEGLYQFLLQKRENVAVQLAIGDVANSRIIDEPRNEGLVSPKSTVVLAAGIGGGIVLPLTIIVLVVLLNTKLATRKEVEQISNLPILGEVSEADVTLAGNLATLPNSRDIITEQYRTIRSNLMFMGLEQGDSGKGKVILVTSFTRGEGKSFTSLNLASILAQTGKRTVVVEFDLRKPKITKQLQLTIKQGLTHILAAPTDKPLMLEQFLLPVHEAIPSLWLLSAGVTAPNPAELLHHPNMDKLFDVLKAQFDYIILDSAPVGLVSDTLGLAKYADVSMYIVRHTFTQKATIGYANELQEEERFKNLCLLINGVKSKSFNYGYGYGGYYHYGYGD